MSNIAGVPTDLTLNGTTYKMYPLKDKDIEQLNMKLKQDVLLVAKAACEGSDPASSAIIMKAAFDSIKTLDWMSDPSLLSPLDNFIYFVWLGIRDAEDKLVSREQFKAEVMKDFEKNYDLCLDTMRLANPFLMKQKLPAKD